MGASYPDGGRGWVQGRTNTTPLENNLTTPAMVKASTLLHPEIPHIVTGPQITHTASGGDIHKNVCGRGFVII